MPKGAIFKIIIEVSEGFSSQNLQSGVYFRDYYAVHVVQIVVPCCGMYEKCHITSAEPRNYLPYPTIWSIIK